MRRSFVFGALVFQTFVTILLWSIQMFEEKKENLSALFVLLILHTLTLPFVVI